MDALNDEQLILHYRQSIHDSSDRLELDHSTFRSCALRASLQLMIALQFYGTGSRRGISYPQVNGELHHSPRFRCP